MYNLWQDQVSKINTKYGPRNKFEIEHGIRQGKYYQDQSLGVLVDEGEVERRAEGLGIEYGYLMISSLLFMNGSHNKFGYRPTEKYAYSNGICM